MARITVAVWISLLAGPAFSSALLDDYMAQRTGSFSSAAQAAVDARYDVAVWHIVEIWPGDDNERWLYVEAWLKDAEAPYMQRVSSVTDTDDGTLLARRFLIEDARAFLDANRNPAAMPDRAGVGLDELEGCEAVLTRAGKGRFEGGTVGNRCGNTYKGASYAISRAVLTEEGMTNWDRGFNAAGEQVWGPAFGGYQFKRLGADDECTEPVRMLVFGELFDRAKLGAYGRALAESGLYPQVGGYYEAVTPVLAVFEGNPPDNRAVIIARFPCLQAAKDFWYSDTYQEIRPLRKDAAEFEVIVLKAPPLPVYLED